MMEAFRPAEPLKPCPFCGGTNLKTYEIVLDKYTETQCVDCHAVGPDNTPGLNWNTRNGKNEE